MSYQVGPVCFSSVGAAGGAACASFVPVTTLVMDGTVIRTVSCASSDLQTGALNLQISSKPVDGGTESIAYVSQTVAFPNCMHDAYYKAFMSISGAVISAFVICWCLWKVASYISHGRADD